VTGPEPLHTKRRGTVAYERLHSCLLMFRLLTQQAKNTLVSSRIFAGAHCLRAAAARMDRQGWRRAEEFRHWSRDRSGRLRPPHHR